MENDQTQLVLGNGFDIYLQLPTKYQDFFKNQKENNEDYLIFTGLLGCCSWDSSLNCIKIPPQEADISIKSLSKEFSMWDFYFLMLDWLYQKDPSQKEAFGGEKDWWQVETQISHFLSPLSSSEDFIFSNVVNEYIEKVSMPSYRTKFTLDNGCSLNYFLGLFLFAWFNQTEQWEFGHKNAYSFALKELKKFEKTFNNYIASIEKKSPTFELESTELIDSFFNELSGKRIVESFNFTKIPSGEKWFPRNVHGTAFANEPGIFGIEALADGRPITPSNPQYIFTKTLRELELEINGNGPASVYQKPSHLIIFGHSLNEQDQGYFFDLFDSMELINPEKISEITFAFCLFDEKKEEEIKKDRLLEATSLINRYEEFKSNNDPNLKKQGSLLSRLLHTGRIRFSQIPRYQENKIFSKK